MSGVWLGQLGRLIQLPYVGSQSVESSESYSFKRTLEGRNVAFVTPRSSRSWSLAAKHYRPNEVSLLQSFAVGGWGPGPFVFVGADAPLTNLFSPAASLCMPAENPSEVIGQGGPMLTPAGWSGMSYLSPKPELKMFFGLKARDAAQPGERLPVISGRAVTASVYVLGDGAHTILDFYDSADDLVSSSVSAVAATAGTVVRSTVTALPPAGAISCRVTARNTVQGCMPSLTWTDEPFDWADGQGCKAAVVSDSSRDLVKALADPSGGRWSDVSFTVKEVG